MCAVSSKHIEIYGVTIKQRRICSVFAEIFQQLCHKERGPTATSFIETNPSALLPEVHRICYVQSIRLGRLHQVGYVWQVMLGRLHQFGYVSQFTLVRLSKLGYVSQIRLVMLPQSGYESQVTLVRLRRLHQLDNIQGVSKKNVLMFVIKLSIFRIFFEFCPNKKVCMNYLI